jgi:hypothetical protein
MPAPASLVPGLHPWRRRLLGLAAAALLAAVLATIFLAYLSPDMVVDLGNRLWSCF